MNMYRFQDATLVDRARLTLWAGMGLGALGFLALGLWLAWSARLDLADLQTRIDRVRALPATQGPDETLFHAAESPNIAQTRLQSQIQEIATTYGFEIEVIRSDEIVDQGRALSLGVMLSGVIPEERFAGFLSALDQAAPKILVETLDLRRARVTSRRDATRKLALKMGLRGMMLK